MIAQDLEALGYRKLRPETIKPKYVNRLVEHWKSVERGLRPATIKNNMAALRFVAEAIGKPGLVKPTNAEYDIPERKYVTNEDRSRELDPAALAAIERDDPRVAMSIHLQKAFGLRREESLKIKLEQADHGDHLVLQDSWCKGKVEREVPIETPAQRELLEEAKKLGPLVPPDKSYKQGVNRYT